MNTQQVVGKMWGTLHKISDQFVTTALYVYCKTI